MMVKHAVWACVGVLVSLAPSVMAEDFGAWSLICNDTEERCAISQVVAIDPEANKVMMGVSVNYAEISEDPMLNIRFANQAVKGAGVGLKVDGHQPIQFPISDCNDKGCRASIWMDSQLIEEMRKGEVAVVAYLLPPKKQVTLPVSLDGFSDAIDHLLEKRARVD